MKKFLLIGVLFFSGCLMRSYVADQARTDMDTQGGNHGYLVGKQSSTQGKVFKFGKARKVAVFEVEFGSHKPRPKMEEPQPVSESAVTDYSASDSYSREPEVNSYAMDSYSEPAAESSYTEYTVKKSDTLQKISQKFYGTTKKWYKIYQDNQDVLSSPDKIYPGLVIKVKNN